MTQLRMNGRLAAFFEIQAMNPPANMKATTPLATVRIATILRLTLRRRLRMAIPMFLAQFIVARYHYPAKVE